MHAGLFLFNHFQIGGVIYGINVCSVTPGHDFAFCTIQFPPMTVSSAFNVTRCP